MNRILKFLQLSLITSIAVTGYYGLITFALQNANNRIGALAENCIVALTIGLITIFITTSELFNQCQKSSIKKEENKYE